MRVELLLLSLAVTDAAFSGYRAAAGYDGRIFKGPYYRTAVARGFAYGLVWIAVAALVAYALVATAPDPERTWAAYRAAAQPMLWIYGSYATLVFSAFVPYLVGGVELRNLASVAIFGPLTLARWGVIAGGAVAAFLATPFDPRCAVAVAVGVFGACCVDTTLRRWHRACPLP